MNKNPLCSKKHLQRFFLIEHLVVVAGFLYHEIHFSRSLSSPDIIDSWLSLIKLKANAHTDYLLLV